VKRPARLTGDSSPGSCGISTTKSNSVPPPYGDGLSSREIGERLYLSPRTVGWHLYRIFPKLEITARAQLAARLGRA
jgi:DNA-binding NarL/FixJ family response regulator